MAKLTVYPHTPMPVLRDRDGQPLHELADDDHRNIGARRRLYTPNIKISAKRSSLDICQEVITRFFALGGKDPSEINMERVSIE